MGLTFYIREYIMYSTIFFLFIILVPDGDVGFTYVTKVDFPPNLKLNTVNVFLLRG